MHTPVGMLIHTRMYQYKQQPQQARPSISPCQTTLEVEGRGYFGSRRDAGSDISVQNHHERLSIFGSLQGGVQKGMLEQMAAAQPEVQCGNESRQVSAKEEMTYDALQHSSRDGEAIRKKDDHIAQLTSQMMALELQLEEANVLLREYGHYKDSEERTRGPAANIPEARKELEKQTLPSIEVRTDALMKLTFS